MAEKPLFSYEVKEQTRQLYALQKEAFPYAPFCIYDGECLSPFQHHLSYNGSNLPVQRHRDGRFKLPSEIQLYVGLSTDFFVEEADEWREEAWRIMRQRPVQICIRP